MIRYVVGMTPTGKSRKQGKAQRVDRPACANLTVHFLFTYRLAMLLPPSGINGVNATICIAVHSPVVERQGQHL